MSSSRPISSASATVATTFLRLATPLHESFTFLLDTDDRLTDHTRYGQFPTTASFVHNYFPRSAPENKTDYYVSCGLPIL
jgi:hypothetical protein